MPRVWTEKDERKFAHIRKSAKKRGAKEERAAEIAARTVNKDRRLEGRTAQQRTSGTGNPTRSLEERTRDELVNRAQQLNIKGRSRMKKSELVDAIRKRT